MGYTRAELRFESTKQARSFRSRLLAWYGRHRRDLPWRRTTDPYRVWVSEVMLQQTRVAAVLGYYENFLARFPTVAALARATESDVLTAWSGLGYYRRARFLHQAAQEVVARHGGRLPESAAALRELPGVGRYTAAAIASIAFGEAVAVVDGNVERVLRRLSGVHALGGAKLWALAEQALDRAAPAESNQAMMELGATVCLPKSPLCRECPLLGLCGTRGEHVTRSAPVAKKKTVAYALALRAGKVGLVQRPAAARQMPGMWELPPVRRRGKPAFELRHSITSTQYRVLIYKSGARADSWVAPAALERLPLTGLARKALRRAGVLP